MRRDASHATPNGGEVSETDATKRRSVVASTHVSDEAAGTISLSDGAPLATQCHYLGHADGLKNTLTPRETNLYENRFCGFGLVGFSKSIKLFGAKHSCGPDTQQPQGAHVCVAHMRVDETNSIYLGRSAALLYWGGQI